MSGKMFKELEKAINEEIKNRELKITVEIKGFDQGFLMNLSSTSLKLEEKRKLNEAVGIAWDRLKKKWFREF
jgi:hypothetical protein